MFAPYNATAEALGADPTAGEDPNRLVGAAFVEGFPSGRVVEGRRAAEWVVEQVRRYPGEVSIYAAGGLTNIALAVRLDEEFASLTKELVVMGGYVDVNMPQVRSTSRVLDNWCDIEGLMDSRLQALSWMQRYGRTSI